MKINNYLRHKIKSFWIFDFSLKINISFFSLALYLLVLLSSCGSAKKIDYFQDIENKTTSEASVTNITDPKIQVGDLLFINITTTSGEAAMPFNLYETPTLSGMMGALRPMPYLVNTDGTINFPVLGTINIEGLSTKQLNDKLKSLLKEYITNPVINIRFSNFRVSVLGEVNRPGAFPILNERMSIIEAISLAGDLTIYGKRKSVLLIRTENDTKQYITLDLTDKNIFESPYFYLKQNDIIYITPNKTRVHASAVGPNTGVIISAVSVLITVIALLSR